MLSSPHDLHVLDYCNTFSFGSATELGGGAYLTEKNSLQTPVLPKLGVCMRVPAPPRPCSLEKLAGGMKPAYSSRVAQIQCAGMFGSPAPIDTIFSDKTNVENQVIPKCPVFQCDSKAAMSWRKCKKKVAGQHGATASEGVTEGTKVSVSLQLGVFDIQDATNVMLKSRLHFAKESCLNICVLRFIAIQPEKNMVRVVMKLLSNSRNLNPRCRKHSFCLIIFSLFLFKVINLTV